MATTFLEPGGDADFQNPTSSNGFWLTTNGTPTIVTDFVHGNHVKSIKLLASSTQQVESPANCSNAGTRISFYLYINALPTATSDLVFFQPNIGSLSVRVQLTSGGVLQLATGTTATQIGSNGSTLSTGIWYRISIAFTLTSTTVNTINLFVNGSSSIAVTNATLSTANPIHVWFGVNSSDTTLDIRISDIYQDNASSNIDMGNVWVTAKRPNANGTTNGFTTQVGSGGSGYGTGHSPQVNERPLSTTNGWSMVGAGSAVTEEYNIEGQSVGDITTVGGTIVDYVGWVSASAALSETGNIIVNNVTSNISLTSTNTLFTKVAGSTTYPAGTGTDIGIITSTTVTTVSLYECGMLIAFIPAATTAISPLSILGAG